MQGAALTSSHKLRRRFCLRSRLVEIRTVAQNGPREEPFAQAGVGQYMKLAPFNGDYKALSRLVQQSWAENAESSLRYTPEFLRSCFEYPGSRADFAPTIYQESRPVAFIAGFPRNVEWCGRPQRLVLSTLLTAASETKGKGYGAWLWMELARKSRASGYDGMISLCSAGGHVNRLVEECGRRLRFPTAQIFSIAYRSALIDNSDATGSCNGVDIDLFLELADAATRGLPFRRVWSRSEAEWQCRDREGALVATLHGTRGPGMITGYVVDTIASPPLRVLMLDDILWHELGPDERVQLLRKAMAYGAERGARIASATTAGYTDLDPLKSTGFRPMRRFLNVYITKWEEPPPEPVTRMYLDVL
jgi:hypothetical protein